MSELPPAYLQTFTRTRKRNDHGDVEKLAKTRTKTRMKMKIWWMIMRRMMMNLMEVERADLP